MDLEKFFDTVNQSKLIEVSITDDKRRAGNLAYPQISQCRSWRTEQV